MKAKRKPMTIIHEPLWLKTLESVNEDVDKINRFMRSRALRTLVLFAIATDDIHQYRMMKVLGKNPATLNQQFKKLQKLGFLSHIITAGGRTRHLYSFDYSGHAIKTLIKRDILSRCLETDAAFEFPEDVANQVYNAFLDCGFHDFLDCGFLKQKLKYWFISCNPEAFSLLESIYDGELDNSPAKRKETIEKIVNDETMMTEAGFGGGSFIEGAVAYFCSWFFDNIRKIDESWLKEKLSAIKVSGEDIQRIVEIRKLVRGNPEKELEDLFSINKKGQDTSPENYQHS